MEEFFIDLHCHSIYSGGCLTPLELVKKAKKDQVKILSLTDHNTVAGLDKFLQAGKKFNLLAIPGVEIYVTYKRKFLHLLGYNFNPKNKELQKILKILCQKRLILLQKSAAKLKKIRFNIKIKKFSDLYYPDVTSLTDQLINKNNLAKTQKITREKAPDLFTLINTFFIKRKLAFLPEVGLPIQQALYLIKQAGGYSILAHPGQQLRWSEDYLIEELKKLGLNGLEVFTPYHNWHQIEHYQDLAIKNKLLITGGSDFHCYLPQKNFLIKNVNDYFKVPFFIYNQLRPFLKIK